jgi:hypothetical protein
MLTKNMKLLRPKVLVDAVAESPTRLDVKTPIFSMAFADSSSNAKSNPLTRFSFAIILLERWFSSFLLSEDDLITKGKGLIEERGRIIDQTIRIQRKENPDHHFLFEDADFSSATIKQQIKEGENDAEAALAEKKEP